MAHRDSSGDPALAVARADCVRTAVTRRRRLRGTEGDLEFLHYLDRLSPQEHAWVIESAGRLDSAGGGPVATEERLENEFARMDNCQRRRVWTRLTPVERTTLLRHSPRMSRWVSRDLVELGDFVHAAAAATGIRAIAGQLDRLAELESTGWAGELGESRGLLMTRLRAYAAELNASPAEQRTTRWNLELDDAARRHLLSLCPWAAP